MKSIGVFLDFDETITHLPSYNSMFPYGIKGLYEDNFRKFIKEDFKKNLKEFELIGIYVITRNLRKNVLQFCKYFDIHFDMIVGAHDNISMTKGNNLYSHKLFNLEYGDYVEKIILNTGKDIREYWSYLKHYSMRKIMKENNIDYGLFFDDDFYNYGHVYRSIDNRKRIELTKRLIPYDDITIDLDPKIIPMEIAFHNKYLKKSGIFHNEELLIESLNSVKLKIDIRKKYLEFLERDIDRNKINNLIDLIIEHRTKYHYDPFSYKSKFFIIEKVIEYFYLKQLYVNLKQ